MVEPMNLELRVSVKQHYGTERVYPVCATSKKFARISNSATLSDKVINLLKELGYTFKVEVKEL